jgi:hypothetical protein
MEIQLWTVQLFPLSARRVVFLEGIVVLWWASDAKEVGRLIDAHVDWEVLFMVSIKLLDIQEPIRRVAGLRWPCHCL